MILRETAQAAIKQRTLPQQNRHSAPQLPSGSNRGSLLRRFLGTHIQPAVILRSAHARPQGRACVLTHSSARTATRTILACVLLVLLAATTGQAQEPPATTPAAANSTPNHKAKGVLSGTPSAPAASDASAAAGQGIPAEATRTNKSGNGREDGSDVMICANLVYAETKSSVCFGDKFLVSLAQDSTIRVARKFRAVKLAQAELFSYPFAIMTGEGSFTLSDAERAQLKRYLEGGGFLLASAGCSSKPWDAAFRRELELIFPAQKLQPLGKEHAIFRTVYDIKDLKTHGSEATLLGLDLGGKTVLIYSPDGLNDTGSMYGCCCCGGNEIRNSRQMNANILAYALMQ